MNTFAGIMRCSRYAFGPNRLHYCGPDANREIFSYMQNNTSDLGLEILLKAFETMFPYLKRIAESNGIKNPFDTRVVEAYWIGNKLLECVSKKELYKNLLEDHRLKKKLGLKEFSKIEEKVEAGALPHHSFHVFNVWKRTGHLEETHTLESMNECRVSWGEITKVDGPFLEVKTEPLIIKNGLLALGDAVTRKITRHLDSSRDIEDIKTGDMISIHWGVPCEILSQREVANLKKYTRQSLAFANQTL